MEYNGRLYGKVGRAFVALKKKTRDMAAFEARIRKECADEERERRVDRCAHCMNILIDDPPKIKLFMGKPVEYWLELEQQAREMVE